MAVSRVTSQDAGYAVGNLSVFPAALDSRYQLYEATNNSQTRLAQSITYNGQYIIVENNDNFPETGILRVGPPPGQPGSAEMIYYDKKTDKIFRNLIRGFAGSRQNPWPIGSHVTNAVFAEHHNACKDALIQIENNLGLRDQPNALSLNGILKAQENKFLAPRALFRAFPTKALPNAKIRFQNFSTGPIVRYLWDFGDGTTSVEKSPLHVYKAEGNYTVKLNIITALGAQGIAEKMNYSNISEENLTPFFYVTPTVDGVPTGISLETASGPPYNDPSQATKFVFMDQTDGNISTRYFVFGGEGRETYNGPLVVNQTIAEFDPNIHFKTYVYEKPNVYNPSLLILFENQKLERAFLTDKIVVE
jgi:hypothetical protein